MKLEIILNRPAATVLMFSSFKQVMKQEIILNRPASSVLILKRNERRNDSRRKIHHVINPLFPRLRRLWDRGLVRSMI